MSLRKLVLFGSLAALLGGCVVAPSPHDRRYYNDNNYYSDDDYYDYYSTPSYEGYYYVRVIFNGNIPYYVDDDRRIRPIPPRLHDHFRNSPYRNRDRHVPYFSRDREVRDGYQMSRVVYFNDVPYYVETRAGHRVKNREEYTTAGFNRPLTRGRVHHILIKNSDPKTKEGGHADAADVDKGDHLALHRGHGILVRGLQGRGHFGFPGVRRKLR